MEQFNNSKGHDRQWIDFEHQLWANIIYTASWVKHSISDIIIDLGITLQQARILLILRENNGAQISTNTLRDKILELGSDTPKLVNRLVEKELVNKKTSAEDKRYLDISLTEKGQQIVDMIISNKLPLINNLFNNLTGEEKQMYINLMTKIYNNRVTADN